MTKLGRFLLVFIFFITPAISLANDSQRFNQVNIQASASSDIANDRLVAMMIVQESGNDPATLAELVNQKMSQVLAKATAFKKVDNQTVNYTTRPIYKNGAIRSWQVIQTIKLSSQDFEQLGKLIAQINHLANVQSMQFTVSDLKLEQAQEDLTKQAIAKFRSKAAMIAKQFGKSSYIIVHVNIGNNYQSPRPMMERTLMASDSMAKTAPALSAGTNKVVVNVNGTIELL